ncbi:MAG TPA: ROK family protein [Bryobacteraceae bacterium]|nr:ROK family protein [Bryobacteraceae bacterium]
MLSLGVHAADRITSGLIRDGQVVHASQRDDETLRDLLPSMPAHEIVCAIATQIDETAGIEPVGVIGVGIPGILRRGIIEESPNLPQLKGLAFSSELSDALKDTRLGGVAVFLFNDADTIAAGIAAQRAELNRLIRVWTLGRGIGFGRYPAAEGVWEGGHMVVTLDPTENHCGCGGNGHLEGIMGSRSIRLRFLDKEPEEVFALAKNGDRSCSAFVALWHRALAAASASCIHLDGPGEFFLMGHNSRFVDLRLLTEYVDSMVAMSALQGSTFAVVPDAEEIGILGAAINAELAFHLNGQRKTIEAHETCI